MSIIRDALTANRHPVRLTWAIGQVSQRVRAAQHVSVWTQSSSPMCADPHRPHICRCEFRSR